MEKKRKPRQWLTWLVVGLVLLLAYPLAATIANRLIRDRRIPGSVNLLFYPIHSVTGRVPNGARLAYFGYWKWWNPQK